MNREKIAELYKEYGLEKDDVFKHQHYLIITRSGIDKIQAKAKITIHYEVIKCEKDFCVVRADAAHNGQAIETFGSALYGGKQKNEQDKWIDTGTTTSWYVMEMAEKRAMSRAVLKLTGFYEQGAFGEDESEDFKQTKTK